MTYSGFRSRHVHRAGNPHIILGVLTLIVAIGGSMVRVDSSPAHPAGTTTAGKEQRNMAATARKGSGKRCASCRPPKSRRVKKRRGNSVAVKRKSRRAVALLVRGARGRRCVVTVRRGRHTTRKTLRFRRATRKRVVVRIRGRGKVRATISCRRVKKRKPAPPAGPQRVPLSPYDTVVVERSSDHLYVYKGEDDRSLRVIYSASLRLPGWESNGLNVDGDYFEHYVHPFSADFSRVLFNGRRTGESATHIGLLDLVTGAVTDLTGPRQGTAFSDPVLCEDNPGFISQTHPVAGNGSDGFVFLSRHGLLSGVGGYCFGDRHLSSVSNPSQASPVAHEEDTVFQSEGVPLSRRVAASEDGKFLYGYLPDPNDNGASGFYTADRSATFPFDCVPDLSSFEERNEYLLGWTGPRTVALAVSEYNNPDGASDFRTATLQPDGTVTCAGGIPPSDREISGISLSFDNQSILFLAEGATGLEKFRQPLAGGPPIAANYPEIPELGDHGIYRVGPALP